MSRKQPTVKKSTEPKLPYSPRLLGTAFEGRAINMVKKIYPALAMKGFDFDDLLQEAALVFYICKEHCNSRKGTIDNPRWFMAFFGRALHNRFVDLQRQALPYISLDELENWEPATEYDEGYYARMLAELPADLKELVGALADGVDVFGKLPVRRLTRLATSVLESAGEMKPHKQGA